MKLTSEELKKVRKVTCDFLNLMVYEKEMKGLELEKSIEKENKALEMATKQLQGKLELLQKQLNTVASPYEKRISKLEEEQESSRVDEHEADILRGIRSALDILERGITTQENALMFVQGLFKRISDKKVRLVKHTRGANIVVIGISGADCGTADYIAIDNKKHSILSALHVNKSEHPGDYSSAYIYGKKRETEYSVGMNKWLGRNWNGFSDESLVDFINGFSTY